MHPLLNISIKAARSASKIIMRSFEHLDTLKINEKGPNDFVTEVDKRAENEIIKIIREGYPEHAVLGEENGMSGSSDYVWIVDPLDGTTNYIHGLPLFSISIAVTYKGRLQHGVIYDPISGDLFTGSRGSGAHLNDRRIRVTKRENLNASLLGIGFPYRAPEKIKLQLAIIENIFPEVAGFRALGSAALTLAYVAAGRLDGAWISCLSPWDIAAGRIIIQEAGGLVSDFSGGENFDSGEIVAGNPKILKALLRSIKVSQTSSTT